MNSLVVLDRLPYPPMGGQQLRYRQAIEALGQLGPVTLLLLAGSAAGDPVSGPHPPVIQVDPEVPHQYLYRWSFVLGRTGKKALRGWLRERFQRSLRDRLEAMITGLAPDVIVVENPELMAFLPPLAAPGRLLIYDAHNVEKLLWHDLVTLRGRLNAGTGSATFRERILAGERALAQQADQVWTCSDEDAQLFTGAYPDCKAELRIVPNAVDTSRLGEIARRREQPGARAGGDPTVLFTGNFGYLPNVEGARILLEEVRPRLLAAEPRLKVVLCGRQPPEELRAAAAAEPESITVTGAVPDIGPWFAACDAVAVPLRHGGGTRLKILEALAAGCPVVSTRKGAEGLRLHDPEHLRLADSPDAMAEALFWCLHEREAACGMAGRGRARVVEAYSWQANTRRVRAALERAGCQPIAPQEKGGHACHGVAARARPFRPVRASGHTAGSGVPRSRKLSPDDASE